jgi:hypothetical protein
MLQLTLLYSISKLHRLDIPYFGLFSLIVQVLNEGKHCGGMITHPTTPTACLIVLELNFRTKIPDGTNYLGSIDKKGRGDLHHLMLVRKILTNQ